MDAAGCKACGFNMLDLHVDLSETLSERLEKRLHGRQTVEEVRALVADKCRESFMKTKFALWDKLFERNYSRQQLQRPQMFRILQSPSSSSNPEIYVDRAILTRRGDGPFLDIGRKTSATLQDISYFTAVAGELRYMVGITTMRTIPNGGEYFTTKLF